MHIHVSVLRIHVVINYYNNNLEDILQVYINGLKVIRFFKHAGLIA